VHSNLELAATIRRAMQQKNLDREQLAQALGISDVMVDKLLCGDVVPSRHLEKRMLEVLNISQQM
jgi:transcriptional regulator with XRE-family HTH domain